MYSITEQLIRENEALLRRLRFLSGSGDHTDIPVSDTASDEPVCSSSSDERVVLEAAANEIHLRNNAISKSNESMICGNSRYEAVEYLEACCQERNLLTLLGELENMPFLSYSRHITDVIKDMILTISNRAEAVRTTADLSSISRKTTEFVFDLIYSRLICSISDKLYGYCVKKSAHYEACIRILGLISSYLSAVGIYNPVTVSPGTVFSYNSAGADGLPDDAASYYDAAQFYTSDRDMENVIIRCFPLAYEINYVCDNGKIGSLSRKGVLSIGVYRS